MRARDIRRIQSDQGGFTLIELLITIAAGIIVTGALFAIQQVALVGTGRVFDRVDATQQARTTMSRIASQLQSSCVADGVIPIQAGSTGTSLRFVSRWGSAASIVPELHVIALTSGNLVDSTYPRTGGASPNWTFSATPSQTRTLVAGVSQSGSTPLFQYFPYGTPRDSSNNAYLDSAGNPYVMLLDGAGTLPTGVTTSSGGPVPANTIPANSPSPLPLNTGSPPGLSSANARLASAVRVTMVVRPSGQATSTLYDEAATFSDTFVLRLTPPASDRNPQTVIACG
jgi:prepilin-type N-terminal cleavage/methylation domain-containing protein